MSLAEVTSRCYQSGISAKKWAQMCHVYKATRRSALPDFESQCELSNAVLDLFNLYPGDLLLYSYLTHGLHDSGLLSLPALVVLFLEPSRLSNLHDTSTLSMLCRLIQEEHYASALPPEQSLLSAQNASTSKVLDLVNGALGLLRVSYTLPTSSFHNPIPSTSQLVMLLLSCVSDMTSVTTAQARQLFLEVNETLQMIQLDGELRAVLESFALSLSMILGDDAKMAQELQQTQSLQLSLGKGDVFGPNSQTDIVTCSLMLRSLVENRTTPFGSGAPMAVVVLVTAFRWSSWTPRVFYVQLLVAAVSVLAQNSTHRGSELIWRSFIMTRLTQLMNDLERIMSNEQMADSDWRGAIQSALLAIQNRTDLLHQCDVNSKNATDMNMDIPESGRISSSASPFFPTLVQYIAYRTTLMDNATRMAFRPIIESGLSTLLSNDCQESGISLDAYIESRLISEVNNEEGLLAFIRRALEDTPNHPEVSHVLQKRVETLCQQFDVDGLGTLCKVFNTLDLAIDIVSLHIRIDEILVPILAFVDDFDCESVGDPQTALEYLGNVVLFLQATLVKYQLSSRVFSLGDRVFPVDYLLSTSTVFRMSSLNPEDVSAVKAWSKALFDTSSEGIEDNILRTTKPKMLMKITATLICQACNACADRRMEGEMLKNGISYFNGPLLNWTLVGGIKALLRDILEKDFNAPVHLEVLRTLVESSSCPQTVLSLTGHGILAMISDPKASLFESKVPNSSFKTTTLRSIASKALGLPEAEPDSSDRNLDALAVPTAHWLDQPRDAIRDFFNSARANKAPAFDVGRCVVVLGPTRFLRLLWDELDTATRMGELELSKRLAVYVLLAPPAAVGAGAGRTPPLLPIFLSNVLHGLLSRLDSRVHTEQTFGIELLVAVITSSLTGLLHLEWALRALGAESQAQRYAYQSSVAVARRLATDLKRSRSGTAGVILQRLSSSPSFVANFPMMAA
ncbi:NUT1 [Sanghuangporus weigelae]